MEATKLTKAKSVAMKLEVVLLGVSDVDRAKAFYENLGWRLDIDIAAGDFRGVQMTLSQMSITETTASPQHKLHWLAEQALNWSGLPVVHVRPTVLLEGFLLIFTAESVRESNQIRLPFGEGKTAPVAVEDVARVLAALLANPQPHIGKIYHLTGPQSENMDFYAQEYSKALGRTITFQDIPVEPWRDALLERGLPAHLVNHLATMADLHRAGRYDRMSNDVLTLTGHGPLSVQDFVRNNAAIFNASAKEASASADTRIQQI